MLWRGEGEDNDDDKGDKGGGRRWACGADAM